MTFKRWLRLKAAHAVVIIAMAVASMPFIGVGVARAQQAVTCTGSGSVTTCVINQPTVTQRLTEYPQIRFQPGDTVAINASGCVQTGGHGKTWKLYVSPQGKDADRLYHGQIWIPGVTSDLVRIQGLNGRTVTVPANFPNSANDYLRLGYEDEDGNYGDNGYWGHDDGDNDQCKNIGPASVRLVIQHHAASTGPSAVSHLPMDLVATAFDANLLFDNPQWWWSVQHGGAVTDWVALCTTKLKIDSARCTSQAPSTDVIHDIVHWPGLCGSDYGVDGHLNWAAATFEGAITFEDHDEPLFGDDDYNMELTPSGNTGLIVGNEGSLHLEFDSDETIDHFRQAWWQNFHNLVDNSTDQAKALVGGKFAIVSGLVGLDLVHNPATEVHPVYAMAIETNVDPADQTWVMFVRNFGDEGECSDLQHYLDLPNGAYTFSIPWMSGATGFQVTKADFQTRSDNPVSGPLVRSVGQGSARHVEVTFQLPAPEAQAHADGELHLLWTGPVNRPLAGARLVRRPETPEREVGAPETLYGDAVRQFQPAVLAAYSATLTPLLKPETRNDAMPAPALQTTKPRGMLDRPRVRTAQDTRVSDRQEAQRRALCGVAHSSQSANFGALQVNCKP